MVLFQCCLAVSLLRGCSCKQLSSSSLVSSPSSTSCLLLTWTTLSASCPMPSPPATPASCTTSAMGVAMLRFDRTLQACCWSNRNWNLGSDCPLSGPRLPECSSPLAPNLRQHVGRIYRTPTPKDDRSGSFGEASFLFQGWHPPRLWAPPCILYFDGIPGLLLAQPRRPKATTQDTQAIAAGVPHRWGYQLHRT